MTPSLDPSAAIALLVILVDGKATLCPFFAQCDGVLVFDPESGRSEFLPKARRTGDAMCEQILATGVRRLVLGFIPGLAAQRLRAAGIDIRLGSCTCAVEELAASFDRLPAA
jgi:hypothetical protein